jgi:D-alanyl-D-alanine dipeptidase
VQVEQPTDPKPVENPSGENVPDEIETNDDPASTDSPDEPAETDSAQPENPADVFPLDAGPLELPVEGATGWAAIAMPLYSEANTESGIVADFDAGQVFVIKEELDDWWYVESSGGELGWVEHIGCFINLPDVIPSIVYNITNAYSATTRSSGYEIPGVTGRRLYEAYSYNPRLSRYEFIVPSLYSSSKLLYDAQQLALEAGDTIIMYEAYRAHVSQQRSVNRLKDLMNSNEEVRKAIEDGPWNLNWFIATTISNHQRGAAFDVSLGKVLFQRRMQVGEVFFTRIIAYEEYAMPTAMHELSPLAAALARPITSRSRDAWRDVPLASTMTPGAVLLQKYFDAAGFTPLASEWWHFNDLEGVSVSTELDIVGSFFIGEILSVLP